MLLKLKATFIYHHMILMLFGDAAN